MPIVDRKLKPGTVVVARYKGKEYRAEVVKTKDGLRYKLEDGREFGSPSSAGSAVKGGGKTCDGWEFWSVEGAPPVKPRAQRVKETQGSVKKAGARPKAAAKQKAGGKAKQVRKGREQAPGVKCGECDLVFPTAREDGRPHARAANGSVEAAGRGG